MEITIELLYWTLVGCALLIVVLQSISISKKNKIQQSIFDDSSAVKELFDDTKMLLVAQTSEQNDLLTNRLVELQNAIVESQVNLEKLRDEMKAQQAEIIVSQEARFDSSSQKQSQLFEQITSLGCDLKDMLAELQVLVSNQHAETNRSLSDSAQAQADNFKLVVKKQGEESLLVQKLLGQSHSNLKELLITLKQLAEKSEFTHRQARIAQLEQLTTQIQKLRTDNLVSLTNELAKHQELTLETDDFLKKLGDCKVTQIEDKHSGQVTQVYYENGIKRSSDTFAGDDLRYQMTFNDYGKPVKGTEFNDKGNVIFEYIYDDAGEISKRIEMTYDQSGTKLEELETAY